MDDILFQILKLVVMLAAVILVRYVVPWIKNCIDVEKMDVAILWAESAVLCAQQTMQASTGAEKKAIVTEFLKGLLIEKNISISDEQLDVLIESAVKEMKIKEGTEAAISSGDEDIT